MEENRELVDTGLRGVPVASTRIGYIDGETGRLLYRGYRIQDLAENATYEEVVHLLLRETLPGPRELEKLRRDLAGERAVPDNVIRALKTLPENARPMDVLQAAVPMLAHGDPDIDDTSKAASRNIGFRLVARIPTIIAAWDRIRKGLEPVAPDPELGHAANLLYMLSGEKPDNEISRFLDICLILHAEHSFNASTFAAREVCSTRAHMYAAVAAAVGSLSGELHGGANARVMQTLLQIGSVQEVSGFVQRTLDEGGKIMGMGHAVYKTMDPRARILDPISRRLGEHAGETKWYEMTKELERQTQEAFRARKGSEIYPNVDFFSASVYYSMGIPIDLFTPVFAASRVAGWAAHIIEEQHAEASSKPVLYRPSSEYVGDYCGPDECEFVPLESR